MTLDERLTRAVHHVADTVSVPEVDVAAVRRTARANQRRTVALAAVVGVLVVASISVAPRLVDHALQPAWRPVHGPGMVPANWIGLWVDHLPSGPVANAAWVDGDVLHVADHTARITGRAITASSPITLYAATEGGWFASVGGPSDRGPTRWGLIQPDGTFVEFQKYGAGPGTLMSPDGSQALLGGDNGGFLIDTATGRILAREPGPDIGAIAWGNDGIFAYSRRQPVMWKPGIGITESSFDADLCHSTGAIRANLLAGYSGCKFPRLASMSPDGTHALIGSHVVVLGTGRRIPLAPKAQLYGKTPLFRSYSVTPSYAVLWEDNEHALIELRTPTEPAHAAHGPRVQDSFVIVRCNVETGSCERASDPFSASGWGLAPLLVAAQMQR